MGQALNFKSSLRTRPFIEGDPAPSLRTNPSPTRFGNNVPLTHPPALADAIALP